MHNFIHIPINTPEKTSPHTKVQQPKWTNYGMIISGGLLFSVSPSLQITLSFDVQIWGGWGAENAISTAALQQVAQESQDHISHSESMLHVVIGEKIFMLRDGQVEPPNMAISA